MNQINIDHIVMDQVEDAVEPHKNIIVNPNFAKTPLRTRPRKRPHNSMSTKRIQNKKKRMAGMKYEGFSTKNKIRQDTPRSAKSLKAACTSLYCKKRKERHCDKFDEAIRLKIFESFWDLSWEAKRTFVQTSIKTITLNTVGKKKFSYKFFLFLNGTLFQVLGCFFCKNVLDYIIISL